jgi:hypothetical protein
MFSAWNPYRYFLVSSGRLRARRLLLTRLPPITARPLPLGTGLARLSRLLVDGVLFMRCKDSDMASVSRRVGTRGRIATSVSSAGPPMRSGKPSGPPAGVPCQVGSSGLFAGPPMRFGKLSAPPAGVPRQVGNSGLFAGPPMRFGKPSEAPAGVPRQVSAGRLLGGPLLKFAGPPMRSGKPSVLLTARLGHVLASGERHAPVG